MAKKKPKVKIVYRNPTGFSDKKEAGEIAKVKLDIQSLEKKRSATPSGFKGFVQRLAINRQINDKAAVIRARDRLQRVSRENKVGKELIEREKIKAELGDYRKKTAVSFESLYKGL